MSLTIKRSTLSNYLVFYSLIILFRVLLDWSYKDIIANLFAYMGFTNAISFSNYFLSWIILIILSLPAYRFFNNNSSRLSFEVLLLLFCISVIPFTTMVSFGCFDNSFIISNSVFWSILFALIISFRLKTNISIKKESRHLIGDNHIKIIAIIFFAIVIYISARYTHFRFNLRLDNVYDLRSEASTYNLPLVLSYAFSWTRTINSIFIAYFIRTKQINWSIITVFIQILSFSIDGMKSTLGLLLFAIIINLLPSFSIQKLNRVGLLLLDVVSFGSIIIFKLFDNLYPASLLIRRMFFIPVKLSSYYYDFFSTHTPDYYRQSFLRLFGFESPYPPISYMISKIYENSDSNANNGLISDAITNYGQIGIVLLPILLFLVLFLMDNVSKGLDPRLYLTVAMYTSMVLVNSFLFRVLLTHGLLIAIYVLNSISNEWKNNSDLTIASNIETEDRRNEKSLSRD